VPVRNLYPWLVTQIKLLCIRECRNLIRDRVALAAVFLYALLLSLLVLSSSTSATVTPPNANLNSHLALIMVFCEYVWIGAARVAGFPEQRPVFLREYSTNHYSVVAYFMSRLSMEIFITALQNLLLVSHPVPQLITP
jgi:hypothetical protein